VWSEPRALAALAAHGVPVVPWRLAPTESAALAAAGDVGYPVVLKVAAPGLVHKSEIGGVALDLGDEQAVRAAFQRVTSVDVEIDGAIVAPMRARGIELIVGVVRDQQWGLVLAVGLGGVQAEALADTALRLLPVGPADVLEMLGELQGRALFEGFRGAEPANLESVATAICALADFAWAVEPRLLSLEVNPMLIDGDSVEALDAVIEWRAIDET
jgi:hypothetical protein